MGESKPYTIKLNIFSKFVLSKLKKKSLEFCAKNCYLEIRNVTQEK